ncbi:polyketide synthase [Gynuella sunshinyii]|uniref:Enoyl-CoA hydratase n=1 Tax=Gynuella sunshinyii YC6258 TaxID=1445510 RepID=A0A0C5VLB0_9GAMM|nr:polyketide synthase [Gynuella sunshinyii]AJQ95091.1 enoyl-CoA hydratase/carnithine racemase [Gynuella sunshinyii YC6258]DAC80070.1 TPA_exp: enoyl-CoA hydratase [Gynuella sunshinyii YC6258]
MTHTASPIIDISEVQTGVLQIRMQDYQHKNLFTHDMSRALIEAFNTVSADSTCKAVILTGFDTYFATGGTQEDLLMLQEGHASFSDNNIYALALECPVPVISAMQGHGIGGGFVMGLFADFVILSRESIYTTNFMKYGFTPGMGATMIVPNKLGAYLGNEMLTLAKRYRGEELKQRGVPFPVYQRAEVLPKAIEIACELAEKPRISLIKLKDQLTRTLRKELPVYIEQEVAMHAETFRQQEVKENIERLFGR